jgi:hypothetical protein
LQFAKIGAPHDSVLVDDLALAELEPYKLVVFLNTFHLSTAQRRLIREKLLNGNRTVVWCYAPGLFLGSTASESAMRELSGFQLVPATKETRVRATIRLNEMGSRLLGGSLTGTPRFPAISNPAEEAGRDRFVVGNEHVWARLIEVRDPGATVLGHREGGDEVVLARKAMGAWTSVYTMNPVLPAGLLRGIAKEAGVHIYNDLDDTLYASRSYLTVAADQAGRRRIRLPRRSDVIDPFTGGTLWRSAGEFERHFAEHETVIWRIV